MRMSDTLTVASKAEILMLVLTPPSTPSWPRTKTMSRGMQRS
jgi:hypothetical protein